LNTLIVTGGEINKNFLKKHLKINKYDIIIAVDKGLETLDILNINPNYVVGDFDSIDKTILRKYENTQIEIIKLNPEKDLTDTHSAINLAIGLKSKKIIIIGAIGTRLDHTIANIHILKLAIDKGINIKIINETNEITLINNSIKIYKDQNYKYISLIPLTTTVENITLKGFKYPLTKRTLYIGDSLGISNEQLQQEGEIQLEKGILILIRSKD
jgi:thiamine pyrophosphokinase